MTPRNDQKFETAEYISDGVSARTPVEFPIFEEGSTEPEAGLTFMQRLGRAESRWLRGISEPVEGAIAQMHQPEVDWLRYGSGNSEGAIDRMHKGEREWLSRGSSSKERA